MSELIARATKGFIPSLFLLALCTNIQAVTLFSDDFESPLVDTPNPVLSWKTPFDAVTNQNGMMFGPGDIYTRSLAIKHSGKYSLRLNFAGRNNLCNRCLKGTNIFFMKAGENDRNFFQDNAGTDFSSSGDFPELPDPNARVYNKTDNWARWQVQSVTNDRLDFAGGAPVQNDMGGDGDFDDGDEVFLVSTCPDGERRTDCNLGINYLEDIVSATHFPLGGTLARRMYVYLPSNTVLPASTLKLGYIFFRRSGNRYETHIAVNPSNSNRFTDNHLALHGSFHFPLNLEKDKWYYIEEVWKRESSVGAFDGEYQLYVHSVDNPTNFPLVNENGLEFGELLDISIVGNWQKNSDAVGSVYIDDVAIATNRIGPTGNDVTPLPAGEADVQ